MNAVPRIIVSAIVAWAAADVAAEAVYRCGNEYRTAPCPGGKVVPTDDLASSADQLEQGRVIAAREKRLADEMVRDRRAREATLRPAPATSIGPSKAAADQGPAASATLKPKKKAKGKIRVVDEKDFVADVPKAKAR
ncbi:MAG TPA: hypothetical protein VHM00_18065 [Caldimonas sp.]|jgi:hypothetical protein|nr:hypothetical protein [Caldimonas sp.]HEX2542972.1 hypothetical protein [Caldimonas sp.]